MVEYVEFGCSSTCHHGLNTTQNRGRGRGGGRGGNRFSNQGRQNYTEVEKHNKNFEKYYDELGVVPEAERKEFWTALRRELPNSFRFTGSKGYMRAPVCKLLILRRYLLTSADTLLQFSSGSLTTTSQTSSRSNSTTNSLKLLPSYNGIQTSSPGR